MITQDQLASLLELLNSDNQGKPGELPAHAWPGGYAMFYVTESADTLCADCATAEIKLWISDDEFAKAGDPPVAYGAFGATDDYPEYAQRCDNCGALIAEGERTV